MTLELETRLATAQARIAWIIDHPDTSDWLKQALRSAEDGDPIALRNDVEMLRCLIDGRSQAQVEMAVASACLARDAGRSGRGNSQSERQPRRRRIAGSERGDSLRPSS